MSGGWWPTFSPDGTASAHRQTPNLRSSPLRLLQRLAYVHFRAMSGRCQRSRVSGVTTVASPAAVPGPAERPHRESAPIVIGQRRRRPLNCLGILRSNLRDEKARAELTYLTETCHSGLRSARSRHSPGRLGPQGNDSRRGPDVRPLAMALSRSSENSRQRAVGFKIGPVASARNLQHS